MFIFLKKWLWCLIARSLDVLESKTFVTPNHLGLVHYSTFCWLPLPKIMIAFFYFVSFLTCRINEKLMNFTITYRMASLFHQHAKLLTTLIWVRKKSSANKFLNILTRSSNINVNCLFSKIVLEKISKRPISTFTVKLRISEFQTQTIILSNCFLLCTSLKIDYFVPILIKKDH